MMMKLYTMPGACSLGPHIVLEWCGAPYEAVALAHADLKKPAFLALNPMGAVPVLQEDDGWTLTQASAILEYIAGKYPQKKLGADSTPHEQAEFHSWLSLLSDVHKAFSPLWAPQAFVPDSRQHDAVRNAAIARVRKVMAILDARLGGRDHPYGNRRTAIDAQLYVFLRWTDKMAGGLAEFTNLQRLYSKLNDDQAIKRALTSEGLVPASARAA
jgi:glutathione S-transferase